MLTANFSELKAAQARFAESSVCMGALAGQEEGAWCGRRPRGPRLLAAALLSLRWPAPSAPGLRSRSPPIHPSIPLTRHPAGKEVMVPLTSSLYVAGVLDPKEKVLVDIGTSFFVGKSAADAKELLAKKAAQLKENTETLFRVINSKRENLETVQQAVEAKQRAS